MFSVVLSCTYCSENLTCKSQETPVSVVVVRLEGDEREVHEGYRHGWS